MSNLTDFIGGDAPLKYDNVYEFKASGTFTVPQSGKYLALVIGSGGGSKSFNGYGGGAGELKTAILSLTKGDNIQITVGKAVPMDNAGQTTSVGNYLSAIGGTVDGGGHAQQSTPDRVLSPFLTNMLRLKTSIAKGGTAPTGYSGDGGAGEAGYGDFKLTIDTQDPNDWAGAQGGYGYGAGAGGDGASYYDRSAIRSAQGYCLIIG